MPSSLFEIPAGAWTPLSSWLSVVAVALCPREQTQQHFTLLRGTSGNPDNFFFPASPSCFRERLYLFWHLSARTSSSFLSYLQSGPERADADTEHPQSALPPCRAGGTLPLELPPSRYGSCPTAPVVLWWGAGTCSHRQICCRSPCRNLLPLNSPFWPPLQCSLPEAVLLEGSCHTAGLGTRQHSRKLILPRAVSLLD